MFKKKVHNPILTLVKTEWKYLGSRKRIFFGYMFLFVVAGLLSLATPLLIGLIFNSIQQSINSDAELMKLLFMISLLFFINVGFWIFHGIGRVMEEKTGFFVHRNFVNNRIAKILELPMKWHKDNHSGETIDKVNRASSSVESFSKYMTNQIVYLITGIVGSIIILFFVDLFAAVLALIFSTIVLFITTRFDKKLNKQYLELNRFGNKVSASIFDYLSNIVTVITLRLRKVVSREVDTKLMASYPLAKKNYVLNETKWAFASISIALMTVIVLIVRAYTDYKSDGIILIGTLYILYGYLREVGQKFYDFAEIYGQIVAFDSAIVGLYPIDKEFDKIRKDRSGRMPEDWKSIGLKGVDFRYDREGKKLHLNNVDLDLPRGKKIAFIGESGSGKSTILSLMRGLNPPEAGEIYSDGELVKSGFDKLKREITLIPQDPEIFNNSIKYNITMDLPFKKVDLDKAIELARFKKVVDRLDNGLNTNVLEKGVSLSGGEKQRLALARGILAAKRSNILLMDEPTSSVDGPNEIKIYENIFKEFKGKTIISSIHRLHLLSKFDYIYFFDKGKIIAQGNMREMKKNARFRNMLRKHSLGKD